MGLAWPSLAQTGATPFWLSLAEHSGTWASPLFGFYLARFSDDSNAAETEAKVRFSPPPLPFPSLLLPFSSFP